MHCNPTSKFKHFALKGKLFFCLNALQKACFLILNLPYYDGKLGWRHKKIKATLCWRAFYQNIKDFLPNEFA